MRLLLSAALAACLAVPAMAGEPNLTIDDPYARSSSPAARAGAAFMTITNTSGADDRLVAVTTDAAQRAELHTHLEDANGVMRMIEVEDGFAVPAGGAAMLARGGDHVMLMGLTRPFVHGETITLTLVFEQAGEITVEVPIDLERQAGHGMPTN